MVRERHPTLQERRDSLQNDSLDCPSYIVDLHFRSLVKYRQESQIHPPTWRGPPKQEGSHISPQDSPIHIQLPQPVTDTYKLVYISHQARGDSNSGEHSAADFQDVDIHPGPALCSIALHVNCKNSSFFSFQERSSTYHGKDGRKGEKPGLNKYLHCLVDLEMVLRAQERARSGIMLIILSQKCNIYKAKQRFRKFGT